MSTVRGFRRPPRGRFTGSRPRRKRIWAREEHQLDVQANAIASHDLCMDFCAELGTNSLPAGATIGGVKFDFRAFLSNAAGLENVSRVAVGIIVVERVGTAPTGLEAPGPIENPHADWMYRETFLPPTRAEPRTALAASEFRTLNNTRQVRSQRKIERDWPGPHLPSSRTASPPTPSAGLWQPARWSSFRSSELARAGRDRGRSFSHCSLRPARRCSMPYWAIFPNMVGCKGGRAGAYGGHLGTVEKFSARRRRSFCLSVGSAWVVPMSTVRGFRRPPRGRFTGSRPRRKRIWAREEHQLDVQANAIASHDLCMDFCAELGTNSLPAGATIGGVKFDFRAFLSNAAGLENVSRVAVGIIVVERVGTAPTGLEAPGPIENPHADWMYRETFLPPTRAEDGTALAASEFGTLNNTRQVRSQRKIEEIGQGLIFVVENGQPADTLGWALAASTLVILP